MNWQPGSESSPFLEDRLDQHGLDRAEVSHFEFDTHYLNDQRQCHGGVPEQQFFRAKDRRIYRVGRFINILDQTDIPPPLRPSFLDDNIDERFFWSMAYLKTASTHQEGLGAYLLPFAFLYNETLPPDEMDSVYMDCVCFDYRQPGTPAIVLWFNDPAVGEFCRCEENGLNPRTQIDYSRCTMSVANSYREFTARLFRTLEELT